MVGGSDSALQEALTLAQFAAKVLILHRGAALGGQACYRERVTSHPKIEIRFNTVVNEIVGESKVTGVRTRDPRTGVSADIETAAVFIYVGLQPNSAFLAGLAPQDRDGTIPTDPQMRTELIGVCAAGNVRSQSPCRAASAAGDGATAAVAVDCYLTDGSWRDGKGKPS